MAMPVRKFRQGASSYRYSINGQEKEAELNENITTALYWEYDSRIGRRWNIDPKPFTAISPFNCFNSSPLWLSDPTGDRVRNGDRIVADEVKKDLEYGKNRLEKIMSDYKITDGMKKKDFFKAGGKEEEWEDYTQYKSYVKSKEALYNQFAKQAEITEKMIEKWRINSPNLFKEIDNVTNEETGMNIDFVIFSKDVDIYDNSVTDVLGSNLLSFTGGIENPVLVMNIPNSNNQLTNAVGITISQRTDFIKKDISIHGKEYLLNHEAGHFLIIARRTSEYLKYRARLIENNLSNEGGHEKDDLSGKKALEYGAVKDIPPSQ